MGGIGANKRLPAELFYLAVESAVANLKEAGCLGSIAMGLVQRNLQTLFRVKNVIQRLAGGCFHFQVAGSSQKACTFLSQLNFGNIQVSDLQVELPTYGDYKWHRYLEDPTLADAILDRVGHNAYRIEIKGESMRKRKRKS